MECIILFHTGMFVESFVYGSFGVLTYCPCRLEVTSMHSCQRCFPGAPIVEKPEAEKADASDSSSTSTSRESSDESSDQCAK